MAWLFYYFSNRHKCRWREKIITYVCKKNTAAKAGFFYGDDDDMMSNSVSILVSDILKNVILILYDTQHRVHTCDDDSSRGGTFEQS